MDDLDLTPITDHANVVVDLRYSTSNNVLGKRIASQLAPLATAEVAEALGVIADRLKLQGLQLVVWDAYRTVDTQGYLKKLVDDERYVSGRSNHLKGLAVDVTLADKNGKYLDMGTDFDDFTDRANSNYAKLNAVQTQNRKTLKEALERAGFKQWEFEWWHFDYPANRV